MPQLCRENSSDPLTPMSQTSWASVFLAIAAGVLASFQLGKVHIAAVDPSVFFSGASKRLLDLVRAERCGSICRHSDRKHLLENR
jgi:hypothetical protein